MAVANYGSGLLQSVIATAIVLVCAAIGEAQWRKVDSGTLASLRTIQFLDADNGWVGGSKGTLLATRDKGTSWHAIELPFKDEIADLHFRDKNNGWLLANRDRFSLVDGRGPSYLLLTKNGGASWNKADLERTPERLTRLVSRPSGPAFAIGEGGVLISEVFGLRVRYANGLPGGFLMLDGAISSTGRIVLVGASGSIVVSDDAGSTWREQYRLERGSRLNAVAFEKECGRGWAVGDTGSVIYTEDRGTSWHVAKAPTAADIKDVEFMADGEGYSVGGAGVILRKQSGKPDWNLETSPVGHPLERLAAAGDRIFAVGFGGTIIWRELKVGSESKKERTK